MIKRLLAPNAIPELAMRRYFVLGKDSLRLFPIGTKQSTRCGVPPDEKRANTTQKSTLRRCGYTDAECLVHKNERTFHNKSLLMMSILLLEMNRITRIKVEALLHLYISVYIR